MLLSDVFLSLPQTVILEYSLLEYIVNKHTKAQQNFHSDHKVTTVIPKLSVCLTNGSAIEIAYSVNLASKKIEKDKVCLQEISLKHYTWFHLCTE